MSNSAKARNQLSEHLSKRPGNMDPALGRWAEIREELEAQVTLAEFVPVVIHAIPEFRPKQPSEPRKKPNHRKIPPHVYVEARMVTLLKLVAIQPGLDRDEMRKNRNHCQHPKTAIRDHCHRYDIKVPAMPDHLGIEPAGQVAQCVATTRYSGRCQVRPKPGTDRCVFHQESK